MANQADIIAGVRLKLRDQSRFFQCDVRGDGEATVFELPVICVERKGFRIILQMATPQTLVIDTDYLLDDRHGQIRLMNVNAPALDVTLFIDGSHYMWLVDEDITSHAAWVVQSIEESNSANFSLSNLKVNDPRFELIIRGTLVEALWALLTEFGLDIDVRNPEGIDIPATQRFRQIIELLNYWTPRYNELAALLNLGVAAIEMVDLRRVSLTTGRLVPIYVEQEVDDVVTPKRLYPAIDDASLKVTDDDAATQYDFPLKRDTAFSQPFTYRRAGIPADISAYTFEMRFRRLHGGTVDKTTFTIVMVDAPNGRFSVVATKENIAKYPADQYIYSLWTTPPTGDPIAIMHGNMPLTDGTVP